MMFGTAPTDGIGLGGLLWGPTARRDPIAYASVVADPGWTTIAICTTEAGVMLAVALMLGALLARPRLRPLLPYAVGLTVALTIALLAAKSGGSANPARQLGPALLAGHTANLWPYLLAPPAGALLGTALHDRLTPTRPHRTPTLGT